MQLQTLVFDSLEPLHQDVMFKGKEYRLVELDVPGTSKFKSAAAASVKLDGEGGMSRLAGSGDLDPLLVELSLKEVLDGGKLGRVSRAFVDTLPPRMVVELAIAARGLNPALDESASATVEQLDKQIARLTEMRDRLAKAEDPAKNSRNGTAASSA